MSRKHTDALKTKLQEIALLDGKVFTTRAPHGIEGPYVVVHPSSGVNTQERVTGPRSTRHPRFTLHVIGRNGDEAQNIADDIEDLIFPGGRGIRIDVEGEQGKPLWFEQPLPVQAQDDPQPTIVYAVIETGWQSDPA